jgi:hypothetical protein
VHAVPLQYLVVSNGRTRINCRFLFFYPGNGTAVPIDCRSRSP